MIETQEILDLRVNEELPDIRKVWMDMYNKQELHGCGLLEKTPFHVVENLESYKKETLRLAGILKPTPKPELKSEELGLYKRMKKLQMEVDCLREELSKFKQSIVEEMDKDL